MTFSFLWVPKVFFVVKEVWLPARSFYLSRPIHLQLITHQLTYITHPSSLWLQVIWLAKIYSRSGFLIVDYGSCIFQLGLLFSLLRSTARAHAPWIYLLDQNSLSWDQIQTVLCVETELASINKKICFSYHHNSFLLLTTLPNMCDVDKKMESSFLQKYLHRRAIANMYP